MEPNYESFGVPPRPEPSSQPSQPPRPEPRKRCYSGEPFFGAIFVILCGTCLFLTTIGALPVRDIWAYWPLFLIAGGLSSLASTRNNQGRVWGIIMILVGLFFLDESIGMSPGIKHRGGWILALVMIGFGVMKLISINNPSPSRFRRGKPWRDRPGHFAHQPPFNPGPGDWGYSPHSQQTASEEARPEYESRAQEPSSEEFSQQTGPNSGPGDFLNDVAVFGAVKRRVESEAFQGGDLHSVFGSVELDLRRARPVTPTAIITINVNIIFGAVKLRIPETWRLTVRAVGIFGSAEDKTYPQPRPVADSPLLVITGHYAFGALEIEN